ncbi:hypothetical protein MAR_020789 [Mya arenaria]|uniref:F5/8 type C domain-containing protein n=1 Tax=Mya arenaria TaxID=6604 RepID=A0ABY7E5V9_MYAAR|nr:hypothetical protein MAR_020789 [Mya arenaria]
MSVKVDTDMPVKVDAAQCEENLIPAVLDSMTSSSVNDVSDKTTNYGAGRGVINATQVKDAHGITQMGAWIPEKSNLNQWLQIQLKEPALIRGLETQGRDGEGQWVDKYRVLYSADCKHWHTVGGFNVTDMVGVSVWDAGPGGDREGKYRVLYSAVGKHRHTVGGFNVTATLGVSVWDAGPGEGREGKYRVLYSEFFTGNSDDKSTVRNMFHCPAIAKCIRVQPLGICRRNDDNTADYHHHYASTNNDANHNNDTNNDQHNNDAYDYYKHYHHHNDT